MLEAKQKIARHRHGLTPGRVVAELTFGFWTSLLDVRYERSRVLWPAMAPKFFSNAPRKLRTRKDQSPYAAQLRTLRNRVFHHEPVWHWPNLPAVVRESETWLLWLNPDVARLHSLLERFHSIHAAGPGACLPSKPCDVSILPLSSWFSRGCVTPSVLAAAACVRPLALNH